MTALVFILLFAPCPFGHPATKGNAFYVDAGPWGINIARHGDQLDRMRCVCATCPCNGSGWMPRTMAEAYHLAITR